MPPWGGHPALDRLPAEDEDHGLMRAQPGAALADPTETGEEWVLCLGLERPIRGSRVHCPMQAAWVGVETCHVCHLLVGISGEREGPAMCGFSDPAG